MRRFPWRTAVRTWLLAAALLLPLAANAAPDSPKRRPDEIVVRFKPGVGQFHRDLVHARHGGRPRREIPALGLHLVKVRPGAVDEALRRYASDPAVDRAEPNYEVSTQAVPNDPLFPQMWALSNAGQSGGVPGADVGAANAWNVSVGDPSAVVVVIDTGVDYAHPDLAPNMWTNPGEIPGNGLDDDANGYVDDVHGINAIVGGGNPMDDHGHGTHVAGTIAAAGNNSLGVTGINWNSRIMACKFIGAGGTGSVYDAIECLAYARAMKDRGVPVVATSNSWGSASASGAFLTDAIRAQGDILFVAAAGNDGKDLDLSDFSPAEADSPNVVSVAATDRNDAKASWSNYGRHSVLLGAPGVDILSTTRGGGYGTMSGTSMATPHVTGVAALVAASNPALPWFAVKNLVIAGGDPTAAMAGRTISGRRLDAYGAMTCSGQKVFDPRSYPRTAGEYAVGVPVVLSALSIDCANSDGPVTVSTASGAVLEMADDGVAPDLFAGDGVHALSWTPTLPTDRLTFAGPGGSFSVSVPRLTLLQSPYPLFLDLGKPASYAVKVLGGLPPYLFSVSSGTLPAGLSLDRLAGVVSGTPGASGDFAYAVTATDAERAAASQSYSAVVDVPSDLVEDGRATPTLFAPGEGLSSIASRNNGNLLVAVNVFSERSSANYAAEITPAGTVVWSASYPSGTNPQTLAAREDGFGDVYVLTQTNVPSWGAAVLWKLLPGTTPAIAWEYPVPGGAGGQPLLAVSPAGDSYVAYQEAVPGDRGASQAIRIAKITPAGALAWTDVLADDPGTGTYRPSDLKTDDAGNAYLAGTLSSVDNNTYAFLRKISPQGTAAWTKTYLPAGLGVPAYADAAGTALGPAGETYLFLTGASYGGTATKNAASLLRLDGNGNVLRESGGATTAKRLQSHGTAVVATPDGNVHVVGAVYDGLDDGNGQIAVLTYRQDGTYAGRRLFGQPSIDEAVRGAAARGPDGVAVAGSVFLPSGGSDNGGYSTLLATYHMPSGRTAEAPTISPAGGTYHQPLSATISCATAGATISYTTDGSAPDAQNGTKTTSGATIPVTRTTTVRAVAYMPGTDPILSAAASAAYSMKAASPTLSLPAGTYYAPQTTIASCATPGTLIRYTSDGSVPTRTNGTEIQNGSAIPVTDNVTIRAIAYVPGDGWLDSDVAAAAYAVVTPSRVAPPTFSLPPGTYYAPQTTAVSSATSGARIRYTTDGSAPSRTNGIDVPSGTPVPIAASVTLKAMAYVDSPEYLDSPVSEAAYVVAAPTQVAAPTLSLPSGTYYSPQTTAVSCATPGATIRYTADGSNPTRANGTQMSNGGSIPITADVTIKAFAYIDNAAWTDSPATTAAYVVATPTQVLAPAFSPPGGTYYAPQSVTISSATSGARIRYTSDGTTPSRTAGTDAPGGVSVPVPRSTTLRAIAYVDNAAYADSGVSSAEYVIAAPTQVAPPTFSLPPGTYYAPQNTVVSSATSGARIRYTTDGSAPARTNGLDVPNGTAIPVIDNVTIRAMAYIDNAAWTDSSTTSATYVVAAPTPVAGPVFSPAGGTYHAPQSVTISCATPGAAIRYTVDGTIPSRTNGTPAASGTTVTVSASATLRAIAYVDGAAWTDSPVATAAYALSAAAPVFGLPPGTYVGPQATVLSSATPGALIRYTADGTAPSRLNGLEVQSGSPVRIAASVTLRAMAYVPGTGWNDSPAVSATYVIDPLPSTATPSLSLPSGVYYAAQTTVLAVPTPGAVIRYTVDGTVATRSNGIQVASGHQLAVGRSMTVSAMAYVPAGGHEDSPNAVAAYVLKVPAPTFSPQPGTYRNQKTVTISCATPGTAIRYTVDGTIPSRTNGTPIASGTAVRISAATTLKAIAYTPDGSWADSDVAAATYLIRRTR